MDLILQIAGLAGWASLIVLPGAWLTFGLTLKGLSFWERLAIGITLAPFVVGIEFYVVRHAGAPFPFTPAILVILNLPAVYLITKRFDRGSRPDGTSVWSAIAALLVPVLCLAPQLIDEQTRIFTGHAWMHGDITYLLANGELWPDDPELAGIKLAYPWFGHIYQGVMSYLLGSAPVSSYIWTNLVWLLCFYGLSSCIVRRLGGNRLAQIAAFIWLCFGLNAVGYLLLQVVPSSAGSLLWIGGDYRYTPWLLKFFFFEQIQFGLAMFASLVCLSLGHRDETGPKSYLALIGFLLCGIGIVYPILFVPALTLVSAMAATNYFLDRGSRVNHSNRRLMMTIVVMVVAMIVTFVHLKLVTVDRVSDAIKFPTLSRDFAILLVRKTQGGIVALSLMLVGLLFLIRPYLRERKTDVLILAITALGSLLLNLFIEIPYWGNEYKFLFTAALCLYAFPALAMQEAFDGRRRNLGIFFAITTFLLALPAAHKIYRDYPWLPIPHPSADPSSFELRLASDDERSALFETLRNRTPEDAILVIDESELHIPTLAGRKLYAPPSQQSPHPGINISSDDLLEGPKGYDPRLIDERRLTIRELYGSPAGRADALRKITSLGHPVVIFVTLPRDAELQRWLLERAESLFVDQSSGAELWIVNGRVED